MSYLLDKKIKRKKLLHALYFIVACLILFYFRSGILGGFSYVSHKIFRPVLSVGGSVGGKFGNLGSYFLSKSSLYLENQNLKSKLGENEARMANYNSILNENIILKEILGRSGERQLVLSAILGKPNQSPYDTLIIDAGANQGLEVGDTVFARGDVPIGRIAEVYPNSSNVILFSNRGEKTQVIISNNSIFMEVVGRGGGNFEMILPRDITLVKGDQVTLPGINPFVVAIVETIISDPRDPFTKALLVSPVNIQELKFVVVETK